MSMSHLPSMEKIRKHDLVILTTGCRASETYLIHLAMVLDTKQQWVYIVYVAGRGSQLYCEPFWIDPTRVTLYTEWYDAN